MTTEAGDITGAQLRPSSPDMWHPEIVSWNVTNQCNLRCDHCYLAAGKRAPAELSLDESRHVIDELAAAGTRMVILTGGEPMMRRDIADMAAYASSRDILVVLGTNGMFLTASTVRRLREVGVAGAGISLDSIDPEKHDRFRGVPGAWKGAVRGIRASVNGDLPVLVQMTALPWNYEEIPAVVELAHGEGATGFTLYFLVCTGRGEQLSDITPQQYEEALGSLVEAQQRYPQMMVRARCAPQITRMAAQQDSPLVGNAGCLAGRHYCRITSEGDVTPCPYLPVVAGSLRERRFDDIWRAAPVLQRLRSGTLTGRCGACDFRELCGGCRARAFALTDDLLAEDPWCTYQPVEHALAMRESPVGWSPEAERRLQRIPPFIRKRVKLAVERHAQTKGKTEITAAEMTATLEGLGRRIPFQRPSGVGATSPLGQGDSHVDAALDNAGPREGRYEGRR